MALRTRSQKQQLPEQLEIPAALMKGQTRVARSTRVNSNSEDSSPQGRDGNTQVRADQLMNIVEHADTDWDCEHPRLKSNLLRKPRRGESFFVSQTDVHKTMEKLMQEATNKLTDRVISIAKQTVVHALKICSVNHNKDFIKSALWCVLNGLLVSVLENSSGIKKSFQDAITQVATAPKSLAVIAAAVARDTAATTPTAWYAARIVKQEVKDSVKNLVLTAISPAPFSSNLSSDKAKKSRTDRRFKKK